MGLPTSVEPTMIRRRADGGLGRCVQKTFCFVDEPLYPAEIIPYILARMCILVEVHVQVSGEGE